MNLIDLEDKISVKFKNKALLEQALTHRSYLNESHNKITGSNERLEFLGDSVLSLVTSNYLYQKFADIPEGDLTNLRASLVKTQTLARVSQSINLGDYLFLSHGEEESGGRNHISILADSLEALIGAIFLDRGLATCTDFISQFIFPVLPEIIKNGLFRDFKSILQENIQKETKKSPDYKVLKTTGPDHERVFTVGVFINDKQMGEGSGHSKQEAQQAAAKAALEKPPPLR